MKKRAAAQVIYRKGEKATDGLRRRMREIEQEMRGLHVEIDHCYILERLLCGVDEHF